MGELCVSLLEVCRLAENGMEIEDMLEGGFDNKHQSLLLHEYLQQQQQQQQRQQSGTTAATTSGLLQLPPHPPPSHRKPSSVSTSSSNHNNSPHLNSVEECSTPQPNTSTSSRLLQGGPCFSCQCTEAPQWRRPDPGTMLLCNRCGIHYMRYKKLPGPKREQHHSASRFSAPSSPLHCGKRKASDAWADQLHSHINNQQGHGPAHFSVGSYPGPSSVGPPDHQQQHQQQHPHPHSKSRSLCTQAPTQAPAPTSAPCSAPQHQHLHPHYRPRLLSRQCSGSHAATTASATGAAAANQPMASPTHSTPNATPILPHPPRPVAAAAAAPHDSADGKLGSGAAAPDLQAPPSMGAHTPLVQEPSPRPTHGPINAGDSGAHTLTHSAHAHSSHAHSTHAHSIHVHSTHPHPTHAQSLPGSGLGGLNIPSLPVHGMGPSVSQTIHGEPRATAPGTDGHSGIGRGGVGSIDGIHGSGLGTRGEQGGLGSDTMGIGPCGVFSAGAAAKGILGSSSNVGEDELRAVIGKDGAGDSMPAASTIFDASQFGTAGATCGSAAAAATATSDKLPSVTCSSVMPLLHPHNTNPINTLGMGKGTSSNVPPIPPPSTTANPFPGALFPAAQPLHLTGTSIIPPFPFHIPTTISALTPPASHALQQSHPQHAHHPAPKKAAAAPPVSAMFSNASSSPLSSTPSSSAAAAAAAPAAPLATAHLASSSSSSNSAAQQQHQLQSMLPPPHSLLNELLGLGVTSHSSSDLQQQQHMRAPQSLLNSVLGGAITKSGRASLPQLPNHLPYSLLQPKDPHVPSGLQTPIYTTPREQTGSETL